MYVSSTNYGYNSVNTTELLCYSFIYLHITVQVFPVTVKTDFRYLNWENIVQSSSGSLR